MSAPPGPGPGPLSDSLLSPLSHSLYQAKVFWPDLQKGVPKVVPFLPSWPGPAPGIIKHPKFIDTSGDGRTTWPYFRDPGAQNLACTSMPNTRSSVQHGHMTVALTGPPTAGGWSRRGAWRVWRFCPFCPIQACLL